MGLTLRSALKGAEFQTVERMNKWTSYAIYGTSVQEFEGLTVSIGAHHLSIAHRNHDIITRPCFFPPCQVASTNSCRVNIFDIMPTTTGHPFTLRYIYLRSFFTVFRLLLGTIQWINLNITHRQPLKDGVTRKRIYVPSREKGRDIKVDLYIPAGYDDSKRGPVLINLHG